MNTAAVNMVDNQLRPNRIHEEALMQAFAHTAREKFVPASESAFAYADRPLPLGNGREIMSALGLAHLLEALKIDTTAGLLILAGNTGYSAAVAAQVFGHVTLVEDDATLLKTATANLSGTKNVTIVKANPATYKATDAFDAVLLDTTVSTLPAHAHSWVKEGGIIAAVTLNPTSGLPTQTVYTRHGHTLFATNLAETQGTPHPAFTEAPGFVF